MKTGVLLFFLCLLPAFLHAQSGSAGKESYFVAEKAYRDGQFQRAVDMLQTGMKEYNDELLPSVCRLLALCYLALDNKEEAGGYVKLLLRYMPYYAVSPDDPIRFADMVRKHRNGKRTLITASQQVETLDESPVPVVLITKEMIQAAGIRTLKEALVTYVPGMTDIESNEEMNVAMRGIYSSGQEKILVMLNGHRLNSYSTNTSRPDFSISLEKVKQIEVLRGPASSLYGGVALTAVVNLITRSGAEINGAELKTGGGNYGQLKGDILFGKQYGDWSLMGWGSVYHASGERIRIPAEEQDQELKLPTSITIGGFNKKPSFDAGVNMEWNNFRLLYNTHFSKTVAPYTMSYFCAPYSYNRYEKFRNNSPGFSTLSHHLEASHEKLWKRFGLKTTFVLDAEDQGRYQVGGDTIRDVGYNEAIPNGTNDTIKVSEGVFQYHNWQSTTWGIALQGDYRYEWNDRNKGTLSAGMQWNRFHLTDSYYLEGDLYNRVLVTFDDSKNLYTGHESSSNAYIQLKHQWNNLIILNLGLRYDYKRRRNGQVIDEYSPRVALILLRPKWNLKLSYAKSFVDAPYFYRNNTLDTTAGSERLLSEYLHSWQLTFASDRLLHGLEFDANLFYNCATDFIVPDGLIYTNAGMLESVGFELSATYSYRKLTGWFNLTWQHVLSSDNYNVKRHSVYNVPATTANLILSYELVRNFHLNTHLTFLSCQTFLSKRPDEKNNLIIKDINIPARAVWNGGFTYRYHKYDINFQIHNLLNKHYKQGGTSVTPIRQQGLWYTLDFAYKF